MNEKIEKPSISLQENDVMLAEMVVDGYGSGGGFTKYQNYYYK